MASLESLTIAQQAIAILSNVRRDILAEASSLNARIVGNQWTASFAAETANGLGVRFVASLQKIADNQARVKEALSVWSVSVAETEADYNQLRQAADAMKNATAANIQATLSGILSQVPEKVRLF